MTEPLYRGEAILLNWNDNKSGRKIVLQIEKDGPGPHPFDGMDGERFAVVIVGPLAPTEHDEKLAGDRDALRGHAGSETGEASVASDRTKGGATPSPRPKKRWHKMPPSQRAGMLCYDPEFWAFLNASNTHAIASGDVAPVETQDGAAAVLRLVCGVTSRSEIKTGHALKKFESVEGNFRAWISAKQHGAA